MNNEEYRGKEQLKPHQLEALKRIKVLNKKPSDFTNYPWDSVFKNIESEIVAQNIMRILARTGNEFRDLSWEEYTRERMKDGNFSATENFNFVKVLPFCISAEIAVHFSNIWNK